MTDKLFDVCGIGNAIVDVLAHCDLDFIDRMSLNKGTMTLIDAARDLGATRVQAVKKVLLPLLLPGVLAGGLLAFTLSIDDYVITFFISGIGTTTLPIKINNMIRRDAPALINALSTIMLCMTFLLVWISQKLNKDKVT